MKVKCIDSSGVAEGILFLNQIYQIVERCIDNAIDPSDPFYVIEGCVFTTWSKRRFEVVKEESISSSASSDECPCGMVRNQCEYHK